MLAGAAQWAWATRLLYILGIKDKTYLAHTYGKKLGKATVSGYCIRFKTLAGINVDMLQAAIRYGVEATSLI